MLLMHSIMDYRDNLNGWKFLDSGGHPRPAHLGKKSLALFTDRFCRLNGCFPRPAMGPAPEASPEAAQLRSDMQAVVVAAQSAIPAAGAVQGGYTSGTATHGAAAPGQAGLSPSPSGVAIFPVVAVKAVVSRVSDATCQKLTQDEID